MVFFKDDTVGKRLSLVVLSNEDDDNSSGYAFRIRASLYDSCRPGCSSMTIPEQLKEWSILAPRDGLDRDAITLNTSFNISEQSHLIPYPLLGRRIIADKLVWDGTFRISGEFAYAPGYWEWAEVVLARSRSTLKSIHLYDAVFASLFLYDRNAEVMRAFLECWCPSTNTLHTAAGELSISLWDLRMIGGLPIDGMFYDEVIPPAQDILEVLPGSCNFLFAAYCLVKRKFRKTAKVTPSHWIEFWQDGTRRYSHNSKGKSSVSTSVYPTGAISSSFKWSANDQSNFSSLEVPENLKEETYLAAFLSYWLCVFALPRGMEIRPETFKVASLMANGRAVSLAVPILALIYRGLREFSASPNLGKCKACLPIHYVYAWLGRYFQTHKANSNEGGPYMVRISGSTAANIHTAISAREIFMLRKTRILWHCNAIDYHEKLQLEDIEGLSNNNLSYFMSIRSSYLVYRQDATHIVETYAPYRFSRQFGFCQGIPFDCANAPSNGVLEDLYHYYWTCVHSGTNSKMWIPPHSTDFGRRFTRRYEEWWSRNTEDYFTAMIKSLSERSPEKVPRVTIVIGKRKDFSSSEIEELPSSQQASKVVATVIEDKHDEEEGDDSQYALKKRSRSARADSEDAVTDRNWKHKQKRTKRTALEEDYDKLPLFVNDDFVDLTEANCTILDDDDLEIPHPNDPSFGDMFRDIEGVPLMDMIVKEPSCSIANIISESSQPVGPSVDDFFRQSALMMGENIKSIVTTSVRDQLPQIAEKLDYLFETIDKLGFDSSVLKLTVEGYLSEASGISALHADRVDMITFDIKNQKITEAAQDVKVISDRLVEDQNRVESIRESLAEAQRKVANLKKALETANSEVVELQSSFSEAELYLLGGEHELEEAKHKYALAEGLPSLSATDAEDLEAREVKFEAMRETLRRFELKF